MRAIDADRLQKQFDEKSINPNYRVNMHNIKSIISNAPTVETIPKADYENRLKTDMVAMLTEIQLEIEEHEESIIGHYGKETKESDFPSHKIERNNGRKECVDLIQQKINALKAEMEAKNVDQA